MSQPIVMSRSVDKGNNPIVNFPFIYNNIPTAPAHGVYISERVAANKECTELRIPTG
jgi:hypothetical protein